MQAIQNNVGLIVIEIRRYATTPQLNHQCSFVELKNNKSCELVMVTLIECCVDTPMAHLYFEQQLSS